MELGKRQVTGGSTKLGTSVAQCNQHYAFSETQMIWLQERVLKILYCQIIQYTSTNFILNVWGER
jgi:hypothetical protein